MPESKGFINKEKLADELKDLSDYFSARKLTNAEATIICSQFILITTIDFAESRKK